MPESEPDNQTPGTPRWQPPPLSRMPIIGQFRYVTTRMQRRIDDQIRRLLQAVEQEVAALLQRDRARLDALAVALLEKEILAAGEIETILHPAEAGREVAEPAS